MTCWVGAAYEKDSCHEVSSLKRSTEPEPEGPGPTPEGPDPVPVTRTPPAPQTSRPRPSRPRSSLPPPNRRRAGTYRLSPYERTEEMKPGPVTRGSCVSAAQ